MNSRQKEVLQAQLDDEKAVIRKLKVAYGRAMAETEAKIQTFTADIQLKKEALQSVTDASQRALLESEIQSKVYQKQYQKALKGQISAIFDNLQSKQYDTIKEYLDDSYTKGFTGTMYDLHGQGIPLILPIDQTQVVDALTMKTKLSKPLYQRLGVDIDSLKKIVNSEISRGIATGRTWAEIAQIIDRRKNINLYRASRIARTEGHRVQQSAAFDAMKKAKGKGADLVKQWDATLDDRTRPDHALLDGQIREVDEPFEVSGYQAMMPGQFGIASEDIHCRCVALQRARWALDDEELQTLKDRAAYFGLDKSKDFDDFRAKYLKAAETEKALQETKNALDACKTVKDVEDLIKSKRWFQSTTIRGTVYDTNDGVKLPGNDVNIAKGIYNALDNLYTKYPQLIGKLNSITSKPLDPGTYAQCHVGLGAGGVDINTNLFTSLDKVTRSYERDLQANFHPANTDWKSIITHEFGHAVDDYLTNNLHLFDTQQTWKHKYASAAMRPKVMRACGLKVSDVATAVSGYASKNHFEWFAECFAEYLDSENPRQVAAEFGKQLEEIMKGVT